MKIKNCAIIFGFYIFCFLSLSAQHNKGASDLYFNSPNAIDFYHLKTSGGIEQNSITSIVQDTIGQIWISTKDGLIRYNSRDFFSYKYQSDDTHSIQNNFVTQVYLDKKGSIWVGTDKGLSKYRFASDDFESILIDDLGRIKILEITEDSQENLWILGQNNFLFCYHEPSHQLTSFKCRINGPKNHPLALKNLLITKNDHIYITCNQATIIEFKPQSSSFKSIPFSKDLHKKGISNTKRFNYQIIEDHRGDIYLASSIGFLLKYHPKTKSFSKLDYIRNKNLKPRDVIMFLYEDEDHNIWIGTWGDGLYCVNPEKNQVGHFQMERDRKSSISNQIITCAFQDHAGYLWFGSEFSGINILKKNKKFTVLADQCDHDLKLPSHPYTSVATDNNQRVWVATDGAGLYYFDKNNERIQHSGSSIIGDEQRVFALLYDSHHYLWIGTGNGLFKHHPQSNKTIHYPPKPDTYHGLRAKNIISLCEDRQGNIWAGSIKMGLTKIESGSGKIYRFMNDPDDPNSLSYNYVSALYCDSNNDIWVGTLDGLNKFNVPSGNFIHFTPNPNQENSISAITINCIYEKAGQLWIGTKGGGLNRYHLSSKKFTSYLQAEGLPSDNVRGIIGDQKNNLWISTTHNISKFNIDSEQLVNYTASDGIYNQMFVEGYGLQQLEFFENFATKDQEGYLYFGGMGGLFYFHPDSLPQNEYKAPLIIENILINGEVIKMNGEKEIVLKPNQNHIEFNLTLLNFIQSDKNQYAYYLENHDPNWVYNGTEAHIEYFDLGPGDYKFYYKGANNDGLWSEAKVPLLIHIKYRFYQTYTFYALLIVFFLLLIISYVFYKWYIKRQLDRQKQLLRYSQSKLDESLADEINKKLKEKLKLDELYLEANLSLHQLAKIIETKPHYLSQVINQYHQRNFHEFINMYRIEMAKKLLKETQLKIEAIAYDSGFNSVSTFNVAFKKETGKTPSKFKKELK